MVTQGAKTQQMNIDIKEDFLLIGLRWWEKILSVHGSLKIPLSHIASAHTNQPVPTWKEVKCPGTQLPGVIKAGTYYSKRGKEFWYVTRAKGILCIELREERFARLVLGTEDSSFWSDKISQRLGT